MEEEKKRFSFKENWNRVDETCPNCHQVTKRVRGLTKQNLKRLVTPQLNLTEFLITFMIIMVLVLAYAYKNETQQTRDWLNSMNTGNISSCIFNCDYRCKLMQGPIYVENVENESSIFLLNLTPAYENLNNSSLPVRPD